jgi:osmotically inducible lipoprotein OsmB
MVRTISLFAIAALVLAACGTTPRDRTVSGAGIGAAGGAVVGAVTGLTVLEGAALGAVGGALTGVLTDPDKLNLGDPFWRRSETAGVKREQVNWPGQAAAGGSELVTRIQAGLIQQGYDPGPTDGVMGPRTAQAIRAYQADNGLKSDGQATLALARHIEARSN